MKTFGQYVVQCLERYDAEFVFGIPGVHTIGLYRGLSRSTIRHITPRHEQAAGFMADGYARVSGKPGVCFVITGPGLTNIATAVAQAYGDSIPMLVISTVNSQGEMGSGEGHLHELPDQRQMMRQITAFSQTIHHPSEFATALARAFALFHSARPRPVHIEIPVAMLEQPCELSLPIANAVVMPPGATRDTIGAVAALCNRAERPLIIAGGGASRGAGEITTLAEKLDAPTLMTINGRGILAPDHVLGLSIGASSEPVVQLIEEADLIIALGTELGPTDFDGVLKSRPYLGSRIIRVDIDPEQLSRPVQPALGVSADCGAFVVELVDRVERRRRRHWGASAVSATKTKAQQLMTEPRAHQLAVLDCVRDTLAGSIIVGDSNQPVYAGCMGFAAALPRSFFSSATGYGTLGYGLPAALGARLAAPHRPVVALMGDGGLQFTLSEMGSVAELGVPLIMLLWNNHGYGEIENAMVAANVDPIGVRIFTPDFAAIAKAFNWQTESATNIADLRNKLKKAQDSQAVVMIEMDEAFFNK